MEQALVASEPAAAPLSTRPKPRGKKRKAKPLRDITAPRQPLTGYVRYLNERRDKLRADNPRLGFAEVTRRLASDWGQLPTEEKQQYLDAAEQDRERYIKEWSAYKETDAYRTFRQQQLERKEAAAALEVVSSAKKPKSSINHHSIKSAHEKSSELPIGVNGNAQVSNSNSAQPNRVKNNASMTTNPMNRPDGCQTEVDIPIFTEQFLQHNKLRETELRQLRKENTDYEQQNAVLQKHIENMRGVVERTKNETAVQIAHTAALQSHFNNLVDRLVSAFGSISLPGVPDGATKQNIEQYMDVLRLLAVENKNNLLVKQARDLLKKIDIVT